MADPFQFDLVSPERLLMSERASQVVVPGSEGQFTVLTGHAPVMTTLRPGIVDITLATGKRERIFVRGGFADVNADGLTILAEHAVPVGELTGDLIASLIQEAEQEVAAARDETLKAAAALKVLQLREVQTEAGRFAAGAAH